MKLLFELFERPLLAFKMEWLHTTVQSGKASDRQCLTSIQEWQIYDWRCAKLLDLLDFFCSLSWIACD